MIRFYIHAIKLTYFYAHSKIILVILRIFTNKGDRKMLGKTFFLEQFLGLIINSVWDCTIERIIAAHNNKLEESKSFESKMYTAIVDTFCRYSGITPEMQNDDTMDFIYTTAEIYINNSRDKNDKTSKTLLHALNLLDARFKDAKYIKKNDTQQKIDRFTHLLQTYIAKDNLFRNEYVITVLNELKMIGYTIEEKQLEIMLFTEENANKLLFAVKENSDEIKLVIKNTNNDIKSNIKDQGNRIIEEFTKELHKTVDTQNTVSTKQSPFEYKNAFSNDTKKDYIKKWNTRLFLHRRPEDKCLTLGNTFIFPTYKLYVDTYQYKSNAKIEELNDEKDDLEKTLDDFITNGSSMLILGQPGMGKTSIVSYLANKYKNDPNLFIIRFHDLKNIELEGKTEFNESLLLNAIIQKLNCSVKDLENKILILDGYDEMKIQLLTHDLLTKFLIAVREIDNFKFIITSRLNYINIAFFEFNKIITLCPFNDKKINEFIDCITENERDEKIELDTENRKVFGIPVILYMALTAKINLNKYTDRISAYNKIFSLNGGILDRFWSRDTKGYDNISHNVTYEKIPFYNILCNTAYYMFKSNNDNSISNDKYAEIIENEKKDVLNESPLWYDFPIDNLYEKGYSVEFVHKSIYEFFVAEYIFCQIEKMFRHPHSELVIEDTKALESMFCINELSVEIQEFLRYRILKSRYNNALSLNIIIDTIYILLLKGPSIASKTKEINKTYITILNIMFRNLMALIQCWSPCFSLSDKCNDKHKKIMDLILEYVHCNILESEINLSNIHFYQSDLKYQNIPWSKTPRKYIISGNPKNNRWFKYSFIDKVNFSKSFLNNVAFDKSSLQEANFDSCVLLKTTMKSCNLNRAFFMNSFLINVDFQYSCIKGAVFASTYIENSDFTYTDFQNTHLTNIECIKINKFSKSHFEGTVFSGNFQNCEFIGSYFSHISLKGDIQNSVSNNTIVIEKQNISLQNNRVQYTNFTNANFQNAKFADGADLRGGIFTKADFRGADLSGAIYEHELDDAILE